MSVLGTASRCTNNVTFCYGEGLLSDPNQALPLQDEEHLFIDPVAVERPGTIAGIHVHHSIPQFFARVASRKDQRCEP